VDKSIIVGEEAMIRNKRTTDNSRIVPKASVQ